MSQTTTIEGRRTRSVRKEEAGVVAGEAAPGARMTERDSSTTVLATVMLAGLGLVAIMGVWGQTTTEGVIFLAMLVLAPLAALLHGRLPVAVGALLGVLLLYGTLMLAGTRPLGSAGGFLRGSLLLVVVWLAASLLARGIRRMEQTLQQQLTLIDRLTMHDPLTGVIRAPFFPLLLDYETARATRYRKPLSLAVVRLAGGAEAGVRARAEVTRRITHAFREVDRVAVREEEEWAVILPYTPLKGAQVAAQRLVSQLRDEVGADLHVGLATHPEHGREGEELLAAAREAADRAAIDGQAVSHLPSIRELSA